MLGVGTFWLLNLFISQKPQELGHIWLKKYAGIHL